MSSSAKPPVFTISGLVNVIGFAPRAAGRLAAVSLVRIRAQICVVLASRTSLPLIEYASNNTDRHLIAAPSHISFQKIHVFILHAENISPAQVQTSILTQQLWQKAETTEEGFVMVDHCEMVQNARICTWKLSQSPPLPHVRLPRFINSAHRDLSNRSRSDRGVDRLGYVWTWQ